MAEKKEVPVPVYREGFANPWALQPQSFNYMTSPHFHPMMSGGEMERTLHQMERSMRDMEQLFPFHPPGQFRSGGEPSAMAPKLDDKNYVVEVQTAEYKPNEITVKTVKRHGHNFLVVEGKHETSDDDGYHSVHHFKRQYMVPDGVNVDGFSSKLDANGKLSIQAPVCEAGEGDTKNVPVVRQ